MKLKCLIGLFFKMNLWMTCLSKTADSEMCAKEKVIDWWNASFEHGTLLIIDPGVYLDKSSNESCMYLHTSLEINIKLVWL